MNFNLPYILQNGMKILNIVNKTLPLVKEVNPALNFIQKRLKTPKQLSTSNDNKKSLNKINNQDYSIKNNQNNTLTFFR